MKQFDEKFSRKAKEAFERYNADHLAGEGWNEYLRKHGNRRRRAIVIPLWAKAASIIVLVTAGVLLTARLINLRADEPVTQVAQETRSELSESATNKVDATSANPEITAIKAVRPSESPVIASTDQASETTTSTLLTVTATAKGPLLAETDLTEGTVLAEATNVAGMSAGMNLPDNPVEIRLADDTDKVINLKPQKALHAYSDIPRAKMKTTIMTGLSGMMASVDNAISTSQGVSIGFYVEQQLTRRISVRPGLAMARHNYALESSPEGGIAMDYTAPELNGMSGTTTSYEADIDVVSMELPLNFVFSLRKRAKSNLFVTTGASTVIYLSQNMSGSFNNTYTRTTVDSSGEASFESMNTSVSIESEQEPLNRADFLGLANFSAGYSLPFGKTSHLLFEPFVQLPLKDLTSMNLRIRYGGLSMKIQF